MVRRSNPLIKIVDFSFANLAIFSSSGCPVGGSGRLAESGCGVLIPSLCVTSALSLSQYCSVTVSTVLLCGVLRSVVRYWVGYSIDSHLCQQSPPLCVAVLHSILKLRIVDWSSITVTSSIATFVSLIYRCDVLSDAKYGNHIFAKNTATQRTGSVNNLIVVWWPCGSSVSCAYVVGGCSQNVADKK